jgi:tetratricopeptide (TPR) repeat protein
MSPKKLSLCIVFILLGLAASSCSRSAASYVDRGNSFYNAGNYSDAALNYRKALQKDLQSGEAYYRLGKTDLKLGDQQEAYRILSRAADLLPNRDDIKIELGNVCLAFYLADPQKPPVLYDRLTKISQQLLAKNSDSYDGLRFQGNLMRNDRKISEAIEAFRHADRIKPMQPDIVVPLVETLFADHQDAEGERLGQELIQARKDLSLGYDLLYAHFMAENRPAEAENVLLAKLRNNPRDIKVHLLVAFHYQKLQKLPEMRDALQKILDDRKDFPEARLAVGDFYATLSNSDEALRQYGEGLKEEPDKRPVYLKKIASLQNAIGKRDDAIQTLGDLLAKDPKDREARTTRAGLLLDDGKPKNVDTAMAELGALLKEKAEDPFVEFNRGRGYLIKNQLPEAAAQFQNAVNHKRDYVPPRIGLAQIDATRHKYAESLRFAEQAAAIEPGNQLAQYWRGVGLRGTGNYQEARAVLTRLAAANPQFVDAQLQLGLIDIAENKLSEAEARFRKIYEPGRDARPLEGLAQTYAERKELPKIIPVLTEELKRSPESVPLHVLLGATASSASEWDLAIQQYEWLISSDPSVPAVYIKLAQAQQGKGNFRDAIATYEKAQAIVPHDGRVPAAIAFLQDAMGQSEAAKISYQQALKLAPGNAEIMNNLAYLILETGGNPDEALAMAQQAKAKAPENPDVDDTVGWAYLKKNMTDVAIQAFGSLVHKYPNQPTYHYHLGLALLQRGDRPKGKAELQAALSLGPAVTVAAKIRGLIAQQN